MRKLKPILIVLALISLVLSYSYFNYKKRDKALTSLEQYCKTNGLIEVFHLRELQFNVFDWLIKDRTQISLVLVDPESFEKDNTNYSIYMEFWQNPKDLSTKRNYELIKEDDKFIIHHFDLFRTPNGVDTLNINDNRTYFHDVNDWVITKYY